MDKPSMRDREKKLVSGIYHDPDPGGHRVFEGQTGRKLHTSRAQIEALAAKLTCCDTCDTVATRSVTQKNVAQVPGEQEG